MKNNTIPAAPLNHSEGCSKIVTSHNACWRYHVIGIYVFSHYFFLKLFWSDYVHDLCKANQTTYGY